MVFLAVSFFFQGPGGMRSCDDESLVFSWQVTDW